MSEEQELLKRITPDCFLEYSPFTVHKSRYRHVLGDFKVEPDPTNPDWVLVHRYKHRRKSTHPENVSKMGEYQQMKYVKKPIVVEAFQFGVEEYPDWFIEKFSSQVSFHQDYPNCCKLINDGYVLDAWTGDMIIKGIQGELYPCKKDIFDATYELVQCEKPFKYPVIWSEND